MDPLLALLEATPPAQYLKTARWGYAAINGAHIFGIALLVGSAVPLALKMFGVWPSVRLETAVRLLRPVAVTGLALAILTGFALFSVQARDYAALTVFQLKLGLIALAALSALWASRRTPPTHAGLHAAVSLLCWPAALACGRLVAFVT